MFGGSTPNITPVQIVAVVGAVLGVCVAAGLPLSRGLQDSIIRLITVLAPVLLAADAGIRHGRARAFAHRIELEQAAQQAQPAPQVQATPAPQH